MIHAIIGTMRARKSGALIDHIYHIGDKKYKVLYPSCCNKVDGYVVTRDGNKKIKATKIYDINDLYQNTVDVEVLFIDEFQFIVSKNNTEEFLKFLEYCDCNNITVYLFGLQVNYLSQSFDITSSVLPFCDTIIVLSAICSHCGKPAYRVARYVDGKLDVDEFGQTLIMESSNVEYVSLCKSCYRKVTGLPAIK